MAFFFSVRGKTPIERGMRSIAMLLVVLTVIWAFWENNERILRNMQQDQVFWDETQEASAHIKSFARDFAKSMKHDFGIEARVQILKNEIDPQLPEKNTVILSLAPATRSVALRMNPEGERELELIQQIEHGFFDAYWDDDWEKGVETALVLVWKHYSGEGIEFMDAVSQNKGEQCLIDESGLLTDAETKFIKKFASGLTQEFGQRAQIHVFSQNVVLPTLDNQTVFIGLSPSTEEVLIVLPPLIKRVVPAGFEQHLSSEHFVQYFEAGDWQQGLKTALIALWKTLDEKQAE